MSAENQTYSSSPLDKDMRYFPRWEVENRVSFHLDGVNEPAEGRTRDISCAGACISGLCEALPNQKIKLTIELSKEMKIDLKGHILWVKVVDGEPMMGITFYDTPDEAQEAILEHAFELDRKKFTEHLFKGWENK